MHSTKFPVLLIQGLVSVLCVIMKLYYELPSDLMFIFMHQKWYFYKTIPNSCALFCSFCYPVWVQSLGCSPPLVKMDVEVIGLFNFMMT